MILIINCGSSSIKFDLFSKNLTDRILFGSLDRINSKSSDLSYKYNQQKFADTFVNCDYQQALTIICNILNTHAVKNNIAAIGHRVVHGGEKFNHSCLIDENVIQMIEQLNILAPIHNPVNLAGIKHFVNEFPNISQIATFDTAFHQTISKAKYLYPVPYRLYEKSMIRKYGMHGTSYSYVSKKAADLLNINIADSAFIIAHLGNGASACAVENGMSIDTTMGMTPLAGLMMGSRCGDIDPGLFEFLAKQNNMSIAEITKMLNKESGMLGISQLSNDCRTLEREIQQGNKMAALSLEMFCHIAAKHIAALMTNLTKLDALIFCGGIGENSSYIRNKITNNLKFFNFALEDDLNSTILGGKNGVISTTNSNKIMVIPTDEAMMIATDTLRITNY